MPNFYWYPYEDVWLKHQDHQCASTLQISLFNFGSTSLLLDLEEGDRYANSFVQIRQDLNQIIKKGRKTFLLLLFSLFFSLRSDLYQIWALGMKGRNKKRCWEELWCPKEVATSFSRKTSHHPKFCRTKNQLFFMSTFFFSILLIYLHTSITFISKILITTITLLILIFKYYHCNIKKKKKRKNESYRANLNLFLDKLKKNLT